MVSDPGWRRKRALRIASVPRHVGVVISLRISSIGKFVATILLVAALVFPQTIDSEKSLLWCLPAYAAMALALLIAAATRGLDFRQRYFLPRGRPRICWLHHASRSHFSRRIFCAA